GVESIWVGPGKRFVLCEHNCFSARSALLFIYSTQLARRTFRFSGARWINLPRRALRQHHFLRGLSRKKQPLFSRSSTQPNQRRNLGCESAKPTRRRVCKSQMLRFTSWKPALQDWIDLRLEHE